MQLCVLIDRGHRELPIEAAFVGRRIQTTAEEVVEVMLLETDRVEKALLMSKQPAPRAAAKRAGRACAGE